MDSCVWVWKWAFSPVSLNTYMWTVMNGIYDNKCLYPRICKGACQCVANEFTCDADINRLHFCDVCRNNCIDTNNSLQWRKLKERCCVWHQYTYKLLLVIEITLLVLDAVGNACKWQYSNTGQFLLTIFYVWHLKSVFLLYQLYI